MADFRIPQTWQRHAKRDDPKLLLLRRAETQREVAYRAGRWKRRAITLPKIKCLEGASG